MNINVFTVILTDTLFKYMFCGRPFWTLSIFFITYGMALYRQYNDKILTLRKIYEYASELRKFSHFHILQLLFPFIYSVGTSDTLSQKHFQVSNNICMQFPIITYGMALCINANIPTKPSLTLWKSMFMRASGASDRRNFWHFYILKVLFLSIFCRYCLSANMYRQISKCTDKTPKKGGSCPLPPPPPPPLATLVASYECPSKFFEILKLG